MPPNTVTLTPPPPAQPAPSEEELAKLRQELQADVQREADKQPSPIETSVSETKPPPSKAEVPPSPIAPPTPETPPGGEAEQIQRIETAAPAPAPAQPSVAPSESPATPTPPPDTAENILEETEETYEERAKGSPEDARTWDAVLNLFKRLRERVMGSKRESSK